MVRLIWIITHIIIGVDFKTKELNHNKCY